jgi:hypothetical protein
MGKPSVKQVEQGQTLCKREQAALNAEGAPGCCPSLALRAPPWSPQALPAPWPQAGTHTTQSGLCVAFMLWSHGSQAPRLTARAGWQSAHDFRGPGVLYTHADGNTKLSKTKPEGKEMPSVEG